LTRGVFKVKEVVNLNGFSKNQLLEFAAAAEFHSNHPIAGSIVKAFKNSGVELDTSLVTNHTDISGRGVEARYGDHLVMIGNDSLLHELSIDHPMCSFDGTVAHIVVDGNYAGYIKIGDEIKPGASIALKRLKQQGIKHIAMLTGDNERAAKIIADELQINSFYADLLPEDKVDIFEKLTSKQGEDGKIAFVGDGINDAPVLARADVGVAMGMKGTEAAKEASEMVLADDNFASIVHAVREGRTVYDNIRKTLAFILPTNGAQAGIIIASVMMGIALPITPLQILWINMITAVTLGLSLAFEPPEGDVMRRPPLSPKEPLLNQFLSWRIVFISAIMVMGTLGLFLWDRYHGETLEMARTTAVNTLIFFQIFYLFNARYLKVSVLSREGLLGNPAVLLSVAGILFLQMLFTYLPLFQKLFGSAAIPAGDWIRLISFTFSVFVLVEIEKLIVRRLDKKRVQ